MAPHLNSIISLFIILPFFSVSQGNIIQEKFSRAAAINGKAVENSGVQTEVSSVARCAGACIREGCPGFSISKTNRGTVSCMMSHHKERLPNISLWVRYSRKVRTICPVREAAHLMVKRVDGSIDFNRPWADYKAGFGCFDTNYWIGLDVLHALTTEDDYGLYVCMEGWDGQVFWARYNNFVLGPESDNYRLNISGYDNRSTAGDGLTYNSYTWSNHDGRMFSTYDRDNDDWPTKHCARDRGFGGWWYGSCFWSKPTGRYLTGGVTHYSGIVWRSIPEYHDPVYTYNDYSFKQMVMALVKF